MKNSTGKVRGETIQATLNFVKENYGEKELENFYKHLSKRTIKILKQVIGLGFYDYGVLFTITKLICDLFGQEDPAFAREIGKYSAKYGFKTFFQMFHEIKDVNWLLSKGPFFYSYYYNFGKLTVVRNTPGKAIVRLTELKDIDEYFEERASGWIEGAFKLFNVEIHIKITKRISKGDEYTEFVINW